MLIGRETEVALLSSSIAAALRGRGEASVLVGDAGVGKSRLARHVSQLASQRGMVTLLGRADHLIQDAPLGPVAEALLAGTRGLAAPTDDQVRHYVPLLAAFLPHWRTTGWRAPVETSAILAEGVLRLLDYLGSDRGLLLVLEDLQWADPVTIGVVGYLAGHLAETRVSLVATIRDGEPGSGSAATLERRGAGVVALGRLRPGEVEAMVTACLEGPPAPETLAAVLRDAGGLPLLVEDLLTAQPGSGPPRRFADIVRTRLGRLDATERLVLAAMAILGPVATTDLVAAVASTDAAVAAAALHHGAALQLLVADPEGHLDFRHALTRDVVVGELTDAEARMLRRAAAGAVRTSALGPLRRALTSAALLADAGDRAEAAGAHLAAGKDALAAGDVDHAVPALERARGDAQDEETVIEASLALAQALLERGDPASAEKVARSLGGRTAGRDPRAARSVWLLVARAATMAGRWDDAAAALRAISRADDSSVAAEVAVLEARIALGADRNGTRVQAEHLAHGAAALAAEAGRPDLQCEAIEIAGLAARGRDLDRAAVLLAHALDLAGGSGAERRRLQVLNELATVEMLRDARPDRLEDAIAEARRVGAIGTAIGSELNLSSLFVMTARFVEGCALASSVAETARRLGLQPIEGAAHLMIGCAAAHQGRRGEAEAELAKAESLAPDDPDLRSAVWAIGRGLLALLEEDRAAARRAFQRAREESPVIYARILNPYEGPDLLVRAVDGDVDLVAAEAAAERVVRGARWSELWIGSARAVLLGARGDHDQASSTAAAALARGDRYPVFHAVAARLVAEAALGAGWGEPVALLQQAEAVLDAIGTNRAASACRALLKRAGRPAPRRRDADRLVTDVLRVAGVTAREAQVLDLLRDRLTNRELADRLYLSPRTVEKHVASLLLKLGVSDRSALADLARTRPR